MEEDCILGNNGECSKTWTLIACQKGLENSADPDQTASEEEAV